MVAEDEALGLMPLKPLDQMSKRERIAELIFRLRDQQGVFHPRYMDACGRVSPLIDFFWRDEPPVKFQQEKAERSPAWQLAEIGIDAVPQLFDVIDERALYTLIV